MTWVLFRSITCHEGRMDGLARQCVYIHLPMYPGGYNRPVTAFQTDSGKLEPLSYQKKDANISAVHDDIGRFKMVFCAGGPQLYIQCLYVRISTTNTRAALLNCGTCFVFSYFNRALCACSVFDQGTRNHRVTSSRPRISKHLLIYPLRPVHGNEPSK